MYESHSRTDPPPLIGISPALLAALEHVSAAAALDRPVLVIGERGTGKELVAARVHFLSQRWSRNYLKINCAALSDDLLESELFGHEAGAFTGATARHVGRFERADGGTLFLDEIATSSSRAQEKILRVVEYGEFERVGGSQTLATDVRVVAAANVDLPSRAASGEFRADLLDRLAFDVITLPPLRARLDDIPVLTEHFGRRMASELGAPAFPGFSQNALETLLSHSWPGNVRELKNVVERAVYRALAVNPLADELIDEIVLDPFESPWRPSAQLSSPAVQASTLTDRAATERSIEDHEPKDEDFERATAAFESRLIMRALHASEGHQGRAARRLGLTYHQFRGLMRKHGLKARRARISQSQPDRSLGQDSTEKSENSVTS